MRYAELGSAKATPQVVLLPGSPAWAFRSENYKYPALPHPLFFVVLARKSRPAALRTSHLRSALINIFSPSNDVTPHFAVSKASLLTFLLLRSTLTLSSFIGRLRRPRLIARICKTRSLNSLSLIQASRRFGAEEERSKPALFFFIGRSASTSLRSGNNRELEHVPYAVAPSFY